MNVPTLTKNLAATKRQRNLLIFTNVLCMLGIFATAAVAVSRQDQTIIMPSSVDRYVIQKGRVSDNMVLAMTRDISNLLLNRHPYDSEYFEENILRIAHPSRHEAIKHALSDDAENNQYRAGIRNWLPQEICLVRGDERITEVKGVVQTYVNGQLVVSRDVVQNFKWGIEGTRLWLFDSAEISPSETQCIGRS